MCEKVKIPEINLTSDSEDLIDDYWFTSPSASFDGSSVNSIPWADDVVKQNQELWERVERMFYGEENLPTNDIKLRNEIIEWTNHFPYLRIAGEQMPIYLSNNVISNAPHHDELIAIHPSPYSARESTFSGVNRLHDDSRPPRFQDDAITVNGNLADDIEKCLRITSGPLLSRRMQNSRTAYGIRTPHNSNNVDANFAHNPPINRNKQGLKSALVTVRSNYDDGSQFVRKLYSSIDMDRLRTVPYSARLIKIPTLKSDGGDQTITTTKANMIRIKTATLVPISRPLRNSITLPAINIEPKYFDHSTHQSLSALINKNASSKSAHSPFNPIKKRSESE